MNQLYLSFKRGKISNWLNNWGLIEIEDYENRKK